MTKEKWMSAAALAILLTTAASCDNWGRKDPPAGNQVYPSLENVATFDFEGEEGLDPAVFTPTANPGGTLPEITVNDIKGNVLCLDNGYVSMSNPFNRVALQKAASFTFWMLQPEATRTRAEGEEEEEPVGPPLSIDGAIFSFKDEAGAESLSIYPDGGIAYKGADGQWADNSHSEEIAPLLSQGAWHFVGIVVKDKGYEWWIDGEKKIDQEVPGFDCSKLVEFINGVPVMTVGGSDNIDLYYMDDLKVFRNMITEKEAKRPNIGSGGGGNSGPDISTWVLLGQEDNSTGFWSAWADYADLKGDGTIHYEFYNYHGGKTNNWENWGLVLTNGIPRGGDGYSEYLYLRADAYGWGSAYNGDNLKHDFDWGTFMEEMDEAFVTIDITRTGTNVLVDARIKTADGIDRFETLSLEGVDAETLGSFLTCEGSHLRINPEEVFVGQIYPAGSFVTGQTDCSTPWWSAHSPNNQFNGNFDKWGVEFINHTTGAGANWNNWLLVCSNGPWVGEGGYAEYFVLRSDAYGWGASFDQGKTKMEQAFDWENYVADMKDAKVKILFSYTGGTLNMDCRQTTADGREMPRYKFQASDLTAPIGLFFTCELAWIEFLKVGYYPWMTVETVE